MVNSDGRTDGRKEGWLKTSHREKGNYVNKTAIVLLGPGYVALLRTPDTGLKTPERKLKEHIIKISICKKILKKKFSLYLHVHGIIRRLSFIKYCQINISSHGQYFI